MKKKLVLIDGNSIAYRAFFALPLLTNSRGAFTNAVYGFTMMLLKVLEEEKPSHILVAFDAGNMTFRHESYAQYKGTRDKTPGELSEQVPLLKEVLEAFQIQTYEADRYEADDIIGTMAKQADEAEIETKIVSGDKDLLQLVSEHVQVQITRKGVTQIDTYDLQAVEDRYGLTPKQMIDLKGLMGDSSDNIPGVPGVGEKTALKLLHQYHTVENVMANIENLSGKRLKERLTEYEDDAYLSKRLATIDCDMSLDLQWEDLMLPDWDGERITSIFNKLEFHSLLKRLKDTGWIEVDSSIGTETSSIDVICLNEANREQYRDLFQEKEVGLSVVADQENSHWADWVGLAISDGKRHVYLSQQEVVSWEACRKWLQDPNQKKVVYDIKTTEGLLYRSGISIKGIHFDVLLASYLLDPAESQQELSDVVERFYDRSLPSPEQVFGKGAKWSLPSEEEVSAYAARQAMLLLALEPILTERLEESDLYSLKYELELPLASILTKMERRGLQIDQERLDRLGIELKQTMEELKEQIYQLAGVEFNINSPKQLGEILFERLHLPVIKKTKTGYSTSVDVLEQLAPQHEIVNRIIHYRQVGKLYSTYIEGLRKEIRPDGKIHTRLNQTITATGRLSSTEPNLQNIPIRMEEGRRIRQIFIPSLPEWFMLAADYSQVELRVLAHLSGDKGLQKAFQQGKDIHTQTAMDVFSVEEDQVDEFMRRQAKAVNYGIVYGISAFGLAQNLQIPQKEAKAFIDLYFATYPAVKQYMEDTVAQAKRDGYVTTLLQRRRYLPEIHSRSFNRRSFAERTAMNTPIQGSAADIIKYAMVNLDREMKKQELQSRMLLQVHDELIFEAPEAELPYLQELVRKEMEEAIDLSIPLQVDISIGTNWYETK